MAWASGSRMLQKICSNVRAPSLAFYTYTTKVTTRIFTKYTGGTSGRQVRAKHRKLPGFRCSLLAFPARYQCFNNSFQKFYLVVKQKQTMGGN